MMKYTPENVTVQQTRQLTPSYYSITFGPISRAAECRPGQFVHVRLPGSEVYFRRAMSIASVDTEQKTLEIIFKIFGRGTRCLSRFKAGDCLDILGPLGNQWSRPDDDETMLIIAGGVGFPPLLYFASEMVRQGRDAGTIEFFYGGRIAEEILERDRITNLGVNFHPVTDDGSFGESGLVTQAAGKYIMDHPDKKMRIYSCGPGPMLKATDDLGMKHGVPGEVSLEAPMPCGYGVCLGCVVPLREGGHARVCQEGPVFNIGEVLL